MKVGSSVEHVSLGARICGILTSPRKTFERLDGDLRWAVAVLALSVGGGAVLNTALLSADFAQREILEQQVASMEALGVTVTDEIHAGLVRANESAPYASLGVKLIGVPTICVLLAGLLYSVGYGLFGAGANFVQVFAVVAHTYVVLLVREVFAVPLNYVRESVTSPTTLVPFAPMIAEGSFAFNLLSAVDLFMVWWIMILAIGLAVVWKRRTAPIAITLYGIYAGVALISAALLTNSTAGVS